MAIDPSGTSFWTGDEISGYVWQVNIATGQVMQTINTNAGLLYGLSVDDEINVATPPRTVATATPTSLTVNPVSGNFSSPTPVSAVLTNPTTGTPDRQRAGDLHPQRLRDLHRHHRQHRDGHLRHHAG